jgi:hypothetical protein
MASAQIVEHDRNIAGRSKYLIGVTADVSGPTRHQNRRHENFFPAGLLMEASFVGIFMTFMRRG